MSDSGSILAEIGARIGRGRNKKYFRLLYQADKTVDVNDFHEKCDSKGPTVTLLHGKHNTLFGGYTSHHWLSTPKQVKQRDADAFLFYRDSGQDPKCCFMPIKIGKEGNAITCYEKFGPTFGQSSKDTFDLQVFKLDSKSGTKSNGTFMILNGMLNIGKCYEVSNPKDTKNKINSGKMEVKSVEVYQVLDDELTKDKWREEPKDFEEMKEELIAMEPHSRLDVKQYNILLVGAVGSGKSSFCNTIRTVFSENVTRNAAVGAAQKSFTNKKQTYDLLTKDGTILKIQITDMRGIDDNKGLEHEIQHILDGRLPNHFKFSDNQGPLEEDQLKDSTLNEETHLVCFVTGITYLDSISSNLRGHFEYVKDKIAEKGLPWSVVVTKMDEICPHVAEDVDHIYKCAKARDAADRASEFFGIPSNQVFPIVNYTTEEESKRGIDRLALHAIYKMYHLVHASLENHEAMLRQNQPWENRTQTIYVRDPSGRQLQNTQSELNKVLSKYNDKELRILCFGPSRSGKSSFIDFVLSTFRNKICSEATRGNTDESSVTTMFQLFPIEYVSITGDTKRSNVYLADMPGIQENGGVQLEDIKLIIKGHVANECKIKNGVPKNSNKFIRKPRPKDRIHCVCFVFDLSAVDELSRSSLITVCREFKTWLSQKGIPFVVVVTKCDKVSERLKHNPARVFEDRRIQENKDKLLHLFKVQESKIYPVQNYINESTTVPQIEVLLLEVIKEVLSLGSKYLDRMERNQETEEESEVNGSENFTDSRYKYM